MKDNIVKKILEDNPELKKGFRGRSLKSFFFLAKNSNKKINKKQKYPHNKNIKK